MTAAVESSFRRKMQLISVVSGVLTCLVGAISLVAWTSATPELVAFKSVPSFPFMLAGLSLCALQVRKIKSPFHIVGLALAAALCFIAGHDLVDLMLVSSQESLESMSGGFAFSVLNSLAANDALSLLLISLALLSIDLPAKRFRLADLFTIVAAFLSMMTLLGVIFGIPGFCIFISCLRISLLEGLSIAVLSLGVLFDRPEEGFASIMTRDTAGGVLARRLLPSAVFVPLLLGWLRMEGERYKLYSSEMGLTILVAMLVLIFLTVIFLNAQSIDRMDRARLKAIEEMEAEIARRKEVEQRFKDFYSNVSHELRSPITSIQGALQLIDHAMEPQGSSQIRELLGTADISCARLLRLINDLLDVKQIEEGKLHINVERVDTLELVTIAVDGLKGMAQSAGVSLNVVMDALGFVMADEDRIIQVLTNLISNAIKFSKVKDQIIVRISQPDPLNIRFSVKDNGPGIAEDQRHKIFGKFEKIDEQDGLKRKGSGLGLAISKGIVEEHGGTIGFNTEIGKGTEFWFELPLADETKALLGNKRQISLLAFVSIVSMLSLTSCTKTAIPSLSVKAPELNGAKNWLNTDKPLKLSDLRGKVVLLDFWNLSCVNCFHTIPIIKEVEKHYPNNLVVIGVHVPKYDSEKETEPLREAVQRMEMDHPIANDSDDEIMTAYGVKAYPTIVLIDPEGGLVKMMLGERSYAQLDQQVKQLIDQFKASGKIDDKPLAIKPEPKSAATPLRFPEKLCVDSKRKWLFVADSGHNRIVISTFDGKLVDVIGTGSAGFFDGTYDKAQFHHPRGLAVDGDSLYIADTQNQRLRKVDLKRKSVSTISGDGVLTELLLPPDFGDAKKARLNSPWDLIVANDNIYITMAGSHQLYDLNLKNNHMYAFAGNGDEGITDKALLDADLAQPSGIAYGANKIFFTDSESNSVRSADTDIKNGKVKTLIGKGLYDYGDIDGPLNKASLSHPLGLALSGNDLYVADTLNHKIKRIDLNAKTISTVWGSGKAGNVVGDYPQFNEPNGIALLGHTMFIADTDNNEIKVGNLATGQVASFKIKNLSAP